MINVQNPLNELECLVFQTELEYADWLMKQFTGVVNEAAEAARKKAILVQLLNNQCKETKQSGTVTLTGDVYEAKIVRGVTPKYAVLDKKADPILQDVYTVIEEARDHIRVSFDERVAGMSDWLAECESNDFAGFEDAEKELINKFISVRSLQPISPQVKITQLKEPESTTVDTNL